MNTTIINNNVNGVFDGWGDYQFRLLFSFWNIQKPWQLGLSCLGLFVVCISLHLIKMLRGYIKSRITINKNKIKKAEDLERQHLIEKSETKTSSCCLYFGYLMTSIVFYTLLLLLTLATTTFNPWIFTSLVLGYTVGDMIVIDKLINYKLEQSYL